MKTAVIYARYSSDSQTEQSIEGQVRVCKQFAEKNDLLVVDQYIDRATTGTNDNRAAFQQMLRDSKKAQWGAVIVYKLDRFARNKYESVVNRKKLKDNGVELVSAMENIPDTPEGKLFLAVIEGFNEYFKQKVNRGLRESWLKGNATGGHPPYGYVIKDKKYVIDEAEAEVVREIFMKYAQGYKAVAIAEDLKARNVRRKCGKHINTSMSSCTTNDISEKSPIRERLITTSFRPSSQRRFGTKWTPSIGKTKFRLAARKRSSTTYSRESSSAETVNTA